MYRLALLAFVSVWVGILFAQEVDEPGYHRPSAAQGLTIETHDVQIVCPDGPSPLTSPPLTVPLTAESPLFPGTPTKSEELDALITPLAPAGAANQLMHDRLQLGGFSPEQHHRYVWTRERRRCCMIQCCLVSVVGTFFLVGYYTGLFK